MRGNARAVPTPPYTKHEAPAANTAAVVDRAETPGISHVLRAVYWSYTGTGTLDGAAHLKVETSIATVFSTQLKHYIANKGPGDLHFPDGLFPSKDMAGAGVKVTLSAGGTDVTGTLSCVFL